MVQMIKKNVRTFWTNDKLWRRRIRENRCEVLVELWKTLQEDAKKDIGFRINWHRKPLNYVFLYVNCCLKKGFLNRIITGKRVCIHYDNLMRKISCIKHPQNQISMVRNFQLHLELPTKCNLLWDALTYRNYQRRSIST